MIKNKEYYKNQLQLAIKELAHKEAIVLTLLAKIENMQKYIDKSFKNRNEDKNN